MNTIQNVDIRKEFEEFIMKKEMELAKLNVKKNMPPFASQSPYSYAPLENNSEKILITEKVEPRKSRLNRDTYMKIVLLVLLICIFVAFGTFLI